MSDMAINQVLAQIRAMEAAASGEAVTQAAPTAPAAGGGNAFADVLSDSINAVNDQQTQASELRSDFTQGDPNVDLNRVMVNLEKASLSFEAVSQTRNRLLSAYREVMRMSV